MDEITENEAAVIAFLKAWNGDLFAAFDRYTREDVVWRNSGLPDCVGRAACDELLRAFVAAGFPRIVVRDLVTAGRGEIVFAQRIDDCTTAAGDVGVSVPVTGVFRVVDGLVVDWVDYFDPTPFAGLAATMTGSGS